MYLISAALQRGAILSASILMLLVLTAFTPYGVHAAVTQHTNLCSSRSFTDEESIEQETYNSFTACTATTTQDIVVTADKPLTAPVSIQLCNAAHDTCTESRTIAAEETIVFKNVPSTDNVIGSKAVGQAPGQMHGNAMGLSNVGNITFNFTLFSFSPTVMSF